MADVEKTDNMSLGDECDEAVDAEEVGGDGDHEVDEGLVVEELPLDVQRRIKALKKVQLEVTKIEAQFYKEMHDLECKYFPLYKPFFEKRTAIVSGTYEPTTEECDLSEIGVEDDGLNEGLDKVKIDDEKKTKVPGIPQFWPQIFRNVELLSEMVQEYDFPILKHLTDIQVEMMTEPMGFKLHFLFSPNEFFSNPILTKTYFMKVEVDMQDPFSFEGPEIIKCNGCPIDWAKGKNVTVKTVRKKQKHKQKQTIRTVSRTIDVPSFFNFFNPPQVPDDDEAALDEETQMKLTNDFEVGQYIRERIVPRAVLYFTGEALEDEEEEEEDFDEEEAEEEENDDDDEDEGHAGRRPVGGKKKHMGGNPQGKQPQECKQQ